MSLTMEDFGAGWQAFGRNFARRRAGWSNALANPERARASRTSRQCALRCARRSRTEPVADGAGRTRAGKDASLEARKETSCVTSPTPVRAVLQEKTRSAEVFAQLVRRADKQRDYARIDALADALTGLRPAKFANWHDRRMWLSERWQTRRWHSFPLSVDWTVEDPVDSEIARDALRRQAVDYGSEEARQIVNALAQMDASNDEF